MEKKKKKVEIRFCSLGCFKALKEEGENNRDENNKFHVTSCYAWTIFS